jgi:hypothetical protein
VCYSIQTLVVYDVDGILAKNSAQVVKELKDIMKKDAVYSSHHVSIMSRETTLTFDSLSCSTDQSEAADSLPNLSVHLISFNESLPQIATNCRTYCRSKAQNGSEAFHSVPHSSRHTTSSDSLPSAEQLPELLASLPPPHDTLPLDVDLVLVFGDLFILHAFPPYHLKNSEILHAGPLTRFTSSKLHALFHQYSACEQRSGR